MLSAFEISADQTSELHQRTRGHAAGRDRADSLMDPLSYFVTPILADVGRSGAMSSMNALTTWLDTTMSKTLRSISTRRCETATYSAGARRS